jgi:hypothetical protein
MNKYATLTALPGLRIRLPSPVHSTVLRKLLDRREWVSALQVRRQAHLWPGTTEAGLSLRQGEPICLGAGG